MNKALVLTLLAAVALAACNRQPPPFTLVEETRVVKIPVTVISEVEVTRFVQLTRLVDVTFEVTRKTQIEVTRIVDRVITNTPRPTETPTPTRPVQSSPVAGDHESEPAQPVPLGSELLAWMINTRTNMQTYGFHIDNSVANGYLICPKAIEFHDKVAASPAFDVAVSGPVVQNAYHNYQNALSIFIEGVNPLTLNCRDFVLQPVPRHLRGNTIGTCIGPKHALGCLGEIPENQWTTARGKINEADDVLFVAINNLDQEFDVPN